MEIWESGPELCIPVLLGTTRDGSESERVAHWVRDELGKLEGVMTRLIGLRTYDIPVMERRIEGGEHPSPGVVQLSRELGAACGLIIVAPEYKNSFPGSLKNALDYLEPQFFRRRPIGIVTVSSGGFGGQLCLSQLRLVCLALGGLPIPIAVPVSRVKEAFDERGCRDPQLGARLAAFLSEMIWYTRALARHVPSAE